MWWYEKEVMEQLDRIESQLERILAEMSTTNAGLSNLQAAVTALTTANNQVVADIQKLLANQSSGPQPGQVIVQQADIDALTASVAALTTADTTADQSVNPPAPSANVKKSSPAS